MRFSPLKNWIIGVTLVAVVLILGVVYGYFCAERQLPGYVTLRRFHNWAKELDATQKVYALMKKRGVTGHQATVRTAFQPIRSDQGLSAEERETIKKLETIGYLSGYKTAPGMERVTLYDSDRTCDGYNLYTSGHAQEAILIDMEGEVVHKWAFDVRSALPEGERGEGANPEEWWTRAHLYENGDLLAIYTDYGLVKLDRQSHPIWVTPGGFHHDLDVGEDGTITALTRTVALIPRIHEYEPILEDFVTVLDSSGTVMHSVSLLEVMENSDYRSFLTTMPRQGDILHANAVSVLDGRHVDRSPYFRRGNVLVSFLTINVIAIVDVDREAVVWALSGEWVGQHHPQLLPSGSMILFDNRGHDGMSKILEFDPLTRETKWDFRGDAENGFFTKSYGRVQRLANGNTLINESNSGRAFEVTPDRTVVWQYYNPARAGEKDELIATLYDFQRVGCENPLTWLPTESPGTQD